MEVRTTTVDVHGKVILIGEHSVVYGKNALAVPVKALNISTKVEPWTGTTWMDTNHYQGPFFTAPNEYDGIKYVLETVFKKLTNPPTIKVTYTGQIPTERGLGSSAVVALGLSRALNEAFQLKLAQSEIMALTNHSEMITHGKASGLDAVTVASSEPVFFNPEMGPKKVPGKLGATLLIMDTGELGNTKEAVTLVHDQVVASQANKAKIERLGELADQTRTLWTKQESAKIGQIFNEAETILASFKLATKRIDSLCKLANQMGAYGAKLSGSGLGGIVIALCPSQKLAHDIAQAGHSNFVNYWIEEI